MNPRRAGATSAEERRTELTGTVSDESIAFPIAPGDAQTEVKLSLEFTGSNEGSPLAEATAPVSSSIF